MEYGLMPGRYPAIVRTYIQARRTCRIEIPGLTDGGDVLPEAEIEYPIGDKARDGANATEIEMTPGDSVWVAFIGGDPRYPIITGYRNPQAGNSVDWRRWHHTNMELLADTLMNLRAGGDITIESETKITLKAPQIINDAATTTMTGNAVIQKALSVVGGAAGNLVSSIAGTFNFIGQVFANGKRIDETHRHGGVLHGGDDTDQVT